MAVTTTEFGQGTRRATVSALARHSRVAAVWDFAWTQDPRVLQISVLGGLLTVGALWCDFALLAQQVALTFVAALATQALWLHAKGLQHKGYLSAVVTGFGLALLVRADNLWVHPLVATLAISSKFVLRYRLAPTGVGGSAHLFNPAGLGAVLAGYMLPGAWLSPGQWGQGVALAALLILLGFGVAARASRSDASYAFLGTFAALIVLRVLWLGASPWVAWHQLQNGALLLFAFFMISDPMTTPREPRMRIAYSMLVALLAFAWQFALFKPNGPVVALFFASLAVPAFNRWAAAKGAPIAYSWRRLTGRTN